MKTMPTALKMSSILIGSAVMALLIGWIDYVTGSELAFTVFYSLPVALAAWYGGKVPGAAIACISACLWLAADMLGEKQYSETWIPMWNVSIRFSTFLITALLVAHVQQLLASEKYLAETDALTGCMNRRSFISELDAELRRSARYRLPMSLAFIDIDNFKR